MNAINATITKVFDLLLTPFEALGIEWAIILVSGIFGILALVAFKHISYQRGIKGTKDRIKGHMIEIRLYQDDLGTVSKAIGKVLLRNLQYLALNFGPFIPLAIPFVFVLAQLVVRYSFDPIPITADPSAVMAGRGTLVRVEFTDGHARDAEGLEIRYPEGVVPVSPLVPVESLGEAYQEVVVTAPGVHELELLLPGQDPVRKRLVAGQRGQVRWMQPERVSGVLSAALWPAEERIDGSSPIARIAFTYPESDLGWLPGSGVLGVLLVFLVASMAFGFAMLKPLGVTI